MPHAGHAQAEAGAAGGGGAEENGGREGPRAGAKGKGQTEGLQVTARRAEPRAGPPLRPLGGNLHPCVPRMPHLCPEQGPGQDAPPCAAPTDG